jgi:hypothetical protein
VPTNTMEWSLPVVTTGRHWLDGAVTCVFGELHGGPEPRLRLVSRGLTSCGGGVIKGARLVWGRSGWTIHPTVSRLVRPEGLERSTDRLLRCCSIKRHRVQN